MRSTFPRASAVAVTPTSVGPLGALRSLRAGWLFLLASLTLLVRFGVNFGSYSLNVALVAVYMCLTLAALHGVLLVSRRRAALYGFSMAVAALSLWINRELGQTEQISLNSFMLLAAIYLPANFLLRSASLAEDDSAWALRMFSNVALFSALAGIAQFYLQFVLHTDWLFNFSPHLPTALQGPSGFNTIRTVGALNKSNGFFYREPSDFSILMALGLHAEWNLQRRLPRIVTLGLALLLTYSGSGVVVLLAGLLFPLHPRTLARLAIVGGAGALFFLLFGEALNLSFTLSRLGEFGSERSSAYVRYVGPLRLLGDTFTSTIWTPLIGHGPGSMLRVKQDYAFHDPTWARLLFEYGVLGFIAFLALFLRVLARASVPIQLRAALFFAWLLTGGHLLLPELPFLALALIGFPASRGDAHPANEREA